MEKGTKLIYVETGVELTFDQIVDGNSILGITNDGFIKIVSSEKCKLSDAHTYFEKTNKALLS